MGSRSSLVDQTCGPRRVAALCAAMAACVALPAMAGDPPASRNQPASDATPGTAADASNPGMMVAIDAATGKVRPVTAAEAKTLNDLTRAKAAAAKAPAGGAKRTKSSTTVVAAAAPNMELRSASGAIGRRVGEENMVYSVVRRNADGTTSLECVTGPSAAAELVNAPQSETARSDEEHANDR